MKKFFYLLLALPLVMVACSDDDDDLPKVDVSVEFENVTEVDGTLYVVQGDEMEVAAINVTNLESGKKAIATAAIYYLDGYRLGASVISPFSFTIPTENLTPGKYTLNVETEIFAVDKTPAFAVLGYDVVVVGSADEIPGGATGSGAVFHQQPSPKAK